MGRKSRAKAARRARVRQAPTTAVTAPTPAAERSVPPPASWPSLPRAGCPIVAPEALPHGAALDPAQRLRNLSTQQKELLDEIEREIRVLLEHGHSWSTVGAALGISRQGARQRYRRLVDGPCSQGGR